ncbi:uncharacterized protein LOC111436765 isoform X1 [Cucurbita moschata]|uniref:Uncharacterized protein LOC111436765 isoform X1 n=1 Tax=Cucurbita moschata TaxID=3662 RepID=A0A6J1ER09_CUCMO|nr:uncharacterized protein LOC111436765 isoform X1 [Cucurbita moschata]
MAPFGGDREDIDCTDTEVFDGQLSPPSCSGEETDKASYSSGADRFYDDDFETQVVNFAGETQVVNPLNDEFETQLMNPLNDEFETQLMSPINDEFETQLVNPLGETQVFNVASETQTLSVCGETQQLDDPIPDGIECMDFDTQILNDFDDEMAGDSYEDEGSKGTEINVVEDLTDDESAQSFYPSMEKDKVQLSPLSDHDARKDLKALLDKLPDKKCNSGPTRLSSIRAASLRSSGSAARSSALQNRNLGSCSVMIDKDIEKSSVKDNHIDQQTDLEQCCENAGELGNVKCRAGSSAVRKLFTKDIVGDFGDLHSSCDVGDMNIHELTACDGDQLAGLSYVDSQEPGDLMQDNALDFVDKFLKNNSLEFDQGGGARKLDAIVQTKSVVSPKGQYNLAKIVNCMRTVGESRVFDWDDNREDEGGGDIFCRRKEEFFTEPRKSKGRRPDSNCDIKGSLSIPNMKSRLFCSDSRIELSKGSENNETAREAKVKCKKNLCNKLDRQNDGDACRVESEDNDIEPNQQEIPDVGFDTQMAAEALETLFNDESINKLVNNEANQHLENSPKDSFGGSPTGRSNTSSNTRKSLKKGRASSSGVVPRQSKKINQKFSGNFMKACENETVKMSRRNNKTDADGIIGNGNTGSVPSNVAKVSPVARRTRHSMTVNQSKKAKVASGECEQSVTKVGPLIKKRSADRATGDPKAKRTKSREAVSKILVTKSKEGTKSDATSSIGQRRSCDMLAGQVSLSDELVGQTVIRRPRSCSTRKTRSSLGVISSLASNENLERAGAEKSNDGNITIKDGCMVSSVVKTTSDESPSKRRKPSDTVCSTPPDNCRTPINAVSPVCMGNEYYKQSCKKSPFKPSLLKELRDLTATGLVSGPLSTESRRRKDMNDVQVLYSQHLDEYIIKQQKKTLTRLGIKVVSSMTEATHFIADKFIRTRNMLEAIALGKLVVTHQWIQSCGQARCFIDEKNYILRDAKKEKEFGFSMPGSLASARQHPLLEGRRVLITPNTKPGKDVISSLVKAVKGQAVERLGRSMLKDDQIPDDLLILSCEEDYDMCMPFLEKGGAVYGSELLLNGIVTQKLEFERYRLFVDQVKRTRSTIWLKKDGNKFHPVSKHH